MKRAVFFCWLVGIVIVLACIVAAFRFDTPIAQFMANHQTPGVRNFMRIVSKCGDWWEHFLIGLVGAAIAWQRKNKQWTRIFVAMLIALSIAGITGRVMKVSTARARPSVKAERVWWNSQHWSSKYHSFPSGHVDASVGFFGVLFLARRRIGAWCLPIPILIAFSRMYLGAHYLSDVVCAALLGILSAMMVAHFYLRRSAEIQPAGHERG